MNCIANLLLLVVVLSINVYALEAKPALRAAGEQDGENLKKLQESLEAFENDVKSQFVSAKNKFESKDINGGRKILEHLLNILEQLQSMLWKTSDDVKEQLGKVNNVATEVTELIKNVQSTADKNFKANQEVNEDAVSNPVVDEDDNSKDEETPKTSETPEEPESQEEHEKPEESETLEEDENPKTPEQSDKVSNEPDEPEEHEDNKPENQEASDESGNNEEEGNGGTGTANDVHAELENIEKINEVVNGRVNKVQKLSARGALRLLAMLQSIQK